MCIKNKAIFKKIAKRKKQNSWVLSLEVYLPVFSLQMELHIHWVRKQFGIPGEVALAFSVVYVQPDYIIRDGMEIEASINGFHVLFIHIVPATLVISQRKQRWQGLVSCQQRNKNMHVDSIIKYTLQTSKGSVYATRKVYDASIEAFGEKIKKCLLLLYTFNTTVRKSVQYTPLTF